MSECLASIIFVHRIPANNFARIAVNKHGAAIGNINCAQSKHQHSGHVECCTSKGHDQYTLLFPVQYFSSHAPHRCTAL